MELLNGLYKLDSDRLNIIVRKNTGNVDEEGNIIYQNLGHFTKMANALKFLHEYHVKTKLNGLANSFFKWEEYIFSKKILDFIKYLW